MCVHLSCSLLSPRSDAIPGAVLMFPLAALVLVKSRRMFLIVQLTALGLLLCIALWTYRDIYTGDTHHRGCVDRRVRCARHPQECEHHDFECRHGPERRPAQRACAGGQEHSSGRRAER